MNELSEDDFIKCELEDCPLPSEFDKVCRVCMSNKNLHQIFKYKDSFHRSSQDLSVTITSFTGVVVAKGDGFPSKICENCISFLQIACRLRTLSENSDRKFKRAVERSKQLKSGEKTNEYEFKPNDSDCIPSDLKSREFEHCNEDSTADNLENATSEDDGKMIVILQTASDIQNIENNSENNDISQSSIENNENIQDGLELPTSNWTLFGCLLCEMRFANKSLLQEHMASTHGEQYIEEFACHGCGEKFENKSSRLKHERKHCSQMPQGSKYKCRKCPAQLTSRPALERHAGQHAGGARNTVELGELFACPVCRKTLLTRSTLRTHVQSLHMQSAGCVCPICNKRLKNKHALYTHAQTHAERAFACDECPYRTNLRTSLTLHKRTHSGDRPYACERCAHRAVNISNLNRHRLTHTGDKNHQCKECGKKYMDKSTLTAHVDSFHRGLRPFFCDKCAITYVRRKDLTKHQKKMHP